MLSFLSSLFSAAKPTEPDQSYGLLRQHNVEPLLRQQQWDAVEALAHTLSGDELSRLLDGVCLTDQFSKELSRFPASSANEFGHLLLGAWQLYSAWQARTAKLGNALSEQEVQGFFRYLELAEQSLNRPFTNPAFGSEAQARLVRVWMGLSEGDLAVESFEASTALDPHKFWAYHHLFKVLSPRWLGSEEALREFVTTIEPPLIRYAMSLQFLTEMYSDLEGEAGGDTQRRWYEKHADLIGELFRQPIPADDNSLAWIYALNNLAYVQHLMGERDARNTTLDQLTGRYTPYPWAYFGFDSANPAVMRKFRAAAARTKP